MTTNKHTKVVGLITALVFVGVATLLGGLVYFISNAKEDFSAKQVEVAKARMHEEELAAFTRLVEESEEERDKLSSYVLYEENIIDFLALLEALAEEQGVAIDIKSLNEAGLNESFEELQASVSVGGSYEATLHLLTLLETLPYQSYVENATVSKVSEDAWTGTFLLHVTMYKKS